MGWNEDSMNLIFNLHSNWTLIWHLLMCPHGMEWNGMECIWVRSGHFHGENSILPDLSIPKVPTISVPFPEKGLRAVYDRSSIELFWMMFDLFLWEALHCLRNHLLFQQTLPRCLQFQLESDVPGWNDTVLDRWGWGVEHLTCILPRHFSLSKTLPFLKRKTLAYYIDVGIAYPTPNLNI